MPLDKSSSKQAFSNNVSTLMHEGRPQKQALAISYSTQKRANRAYGGGIRGYDDGGDVMPLDPVMEAQAAREAASARVARGVMPPEGRQEGALTESIPDLIPGRSAVRNIASGNYGQGALDVASDLVPFAKMVPAPVRRAALSGGILGAGALMPVNSDQARAEDLTWMTPQQKSAHAAIRGRDVPETRILRGKFVQEQLALAQARQDKLKDQEAAVQRAKEESYIASAAEERKLAAMRADEGARVEQERQARLQAEHDATAEMERKSKLPFRERHPEAAMGIQGAMLGLSAALPFGQTLNKNRNWTNIANRAEEAMAAGNKPASKLAVDQLRQYDKPMNWKEKAAIANTAVLPLEGGTVIPNAWDYYSLGGDESNPNWQAARRELNPLEGKFWENAGIGLVEGVPIGLAGSKLANWMRPAPKPQSEGLIKSFEERKSWPRAQKPQTAPAKPELAPVSKRAQTRKKAAPSESTGGSIRTYAGGGGIAGGFDEAFGDLFHNVPQFQQAIQNAESKLPNGISGLLGQLPGEMSQGSPSSPNMTGLTNGVSRMAPMPMGSGVATPGMSAGSGQQWPTMARNSPVAARNRSDGGGFDMQKGPHLQTGWQARSEARNMVHQGPIMGSSPGRADNHAIHVPSGSYVLPASHVSAMGEGNTMAGVAKLDKLFRQGPYSTSIPHLGHGAGIPKGPRLQKVAHSGGGKGGSDNIGSPTPVNISSGEYLIHPDSIRNVIHPDLDSAHKVLDSWVMQARKKNIKELKNLEPPATD